MYHRIHIEGHCHEGTTRRSGAPSHRDADCGHADRWRQVQSARIAAERAPQPTAGSSAITTRRIADARVAVASSTGGKVRPGSSRDRENLASSSARKADCAPRSTAPPQILLGDTGGLAFVLDDLEDPTLPRCDLGHLGLECRSCCLERCHLRRVSLRKHRDVRRRWLFGEGRIRLVQCLDGGRDTGRGFVGSEDPHARPDHEVLELRPVTTHHLPMVANGTARPTVERGGWSGRRGSNSRHAAWKAAALPTELLPPERKV
jgi:hypothetical protein